MDEGKPDIYDDPNERRNLRFKYRQLIAETEQNQGEYVQPDSEGLHHALLEGNKLFKKVRRTREAAMDSHLLTVVSHLAIERAQHFQPGIVTFEMRTFTEKLITFMGGRSVEDEPDEEGNLQDVRLDSLDWMKVGKIAANSFRRTPAIEFMHGPLSMDASQPKPQKLQKPKAGEKPGVSASVSPEQLVNVDNNNEEATTKEVQRVFEALTRVTDQGEDEDIKPVSFFKFVTNPNSFGQTVENIFHLSFLVNKGNAAIELDENGLPVVFPSEPYSEKEDYMNTDTSRKQVVMPFTMEDWRNSVEIFNIKRPLIPSRKTVRDEQMQQD